MENIGITQPYVDYADAIIGIHQTADTTATISRARIEEQVLLQLVGDAGEDLDALLKIAWMDAILRGDHFNAYWTKKMDDLHLTQEQVEPYRPDEELYDNNVPPGPPSPPAANPAPAPPRRNPPRRARTAPPPAPAAAPAPRRRNPRRRARPAVPVAPAAPVAPVAPPAPIVPPIAHPAAAAPPRPIRRAPGHVVRRRLRSRRVHFAPGVEVREF